MSEFLEIESVNHRGEEYFRIDPKDVNFDSMEKVKKITDIIALKVVSGRVKIVTSHGDDVETESYAEIGDYIVYNIGVSEFDNLIDKMLNSDKKVIKSHNFRNLYSSHANEINLSGDDINKLYEDLKSDNEDNSDFSDFNFASSSANQYEYVGRPVSVARVPFNFVIAAPWGSDQFIKAGGYIVFNPNTFISNGVKDVYGIEGAHDKEAGQMEKTYQLVDSSAYGKEMPNGSVINDTFKMVIKADKSPIAGIQFNMRDLAKAYDKIGKELTESLEKYL